MTKQQALAVVLREADKQNLVLSSHELAVRASFLVEDAAKLQQARAEYDSLSSKNTKLQMKPITTLNALTAPVLRELVQSSAAEFLGEEFWTSLNTQSERLAAKRAFNEIRERLTRGMC